MKFFPLLIIVATVFGCTQVLEEGGPERNADDQGRARSSESHIKTVGISEVSVVEPVFLGFETEDLCGQVLQPETLKPFGSIYINDKGLHVCLGEFSDSNQTDFVFDLGVQARHGLLLTVSENATGIRDASAVLSMDNAELLSLTTRHTSNGSNFVISGSGKVDKLNPNAFENFKQKKQFTNYGVTTGFPRYPDLSYFNMIDRDGTEVFAHALVDLASLPAVQSSYDSMFQNAAPVEVKLLGEDAGCKGASANGIAYFKTYESYKACDGTEEKSDSVGSAGDRTFVGAFKVSDSRVVIEYIVGAGGNEFRCREFGKSKDVWSSYLQGEDHSFKLNKTFCNNLIRVVGPADSPTGFEVYYNAHIARVALTLSSVELPVIK